MPNPAEVSLAHNGVLFLDELPEFNRAALESLRQPLEDGSVPVYPGHASGQYQSSFMLIAGMNPAPADTSGAGTVKARCTTEEIRRYLDRISGPLLDRIDLQMEVDSVPVREISGAPRGEFRGGGNSGGGGPEKAAGALPGNGHSLQRQAG